MNISSISEKSGETFENRSNNSADGVHSPALRESLIEEPQKTEQFDMSQLFDMENRQSMAMKKAKSTLKDDKNSKFIKDQMALQANIS